MNKMGTIIGFTFKNKVRTKSFLITTLILVLLISVGMNIPYIIDKFQGEDKTGGQVQIGIVTESGNRAAELLLAYTPAADQETKLGFTVYPSETDAQLKKDLDDEKVKGYLTFAADGQEGLASVTYHSSKGDLKDNVKTLLQTALQQVNTQLIAGDKLSADQITAMYRPVTIDTKQLNVSGDSTGQEEADTSAPTINYVAVYVALMLFFMSIMMTGNMIAAEITSEKSSRIMEILITSAAPLTQMFGKVIGVFLVGILQIALFVATIAVNLTLPHNSGVLTDFDLDLSQLDTSLLFYGLLLYILGFFLYALLYAAVGSIVSRTEDLGQAAMPVMMLGFVAFYIPLFSMSAPDTLLIKVASYVPFTSPLSLLLRIGIGEVAGWEIAISLVLLLATTFFMGWLSAKIYRTGVLMYGKRPSIAEIRKAMKAYKI
ncbi:ABC transporter permease [Paenibacillus sp. NFR01]|uniref:ABC transporter permease n=1 Tax=Paenibacillus sp. NFR01 TaxID=1566279 RepID=UPI0008CF7DA0|nr:ABC transporter permease [Paenibacillus sp. NFR01]SEU29658.1 ABC-2 type transport system permease protein [Paenibacillus sp. NFR01]